MGELMIFIYLAGLLVIFGWVIQLGAHPRSSRTAFAAMLMAIGIMLIVGTVVLTVINLIIMAWS